MTEAEAKTRWCPFSGNPNDKQLNRCIGSECMAWRSTEPVWEPLGDGSANEKCVPTGYCGLAGKP